MATGRRTKLTLETAKAIADGIYPAGNYFETACRLAHIDPSTGFRWLAIGEGRKKNNTKQPSEMFKEFSRLVRYSEAQLENAVVLAWRTQISDDWRAGEAFLKQRFPSRWRVSEQVEISGPGGKPIEVRDSNVITLRISDEEDPRDAKQKH